MVPLYSKVRFTFRFGTKVAPAFTWVFRTFRPAGSSWKLIPPPRFASIPSYNLATLYSNIDMFESFPPATVSSFPLRVSDWNKVWKGTAATDAVYTTASR